MRFTPTPDRVLVQLGGLITLQESVVLAFGVTKGTGHLVTNYTQYRLKGNNNMIPWSFISDRKINFEPGITCRLKCAGCYMRADGMSKTKNPEDHISMGWDRRYNIPLEKYKIIFEVFNTFEFCGNLSDPIYHPDFVETLKHLQGKNLEIIFRTNGSGKSREWWTEVFELCRTENWRWTFALDGLPKDSHKYRINQDGEQVFEMMKLGAELGIDIQWQWIVFNYNQYDIDQGMLMADRYHIKFEYYHSTRWDRPELITLKPSVEHAANERASYDVTNKIKVEIAADCLRAHLTKDIMFNSMGYFIPCCEQDGLVESMESLGFYQEKFHIDNLHTVEDIKNVFMSDTWQNFYIGLVNDAANAPKKCQSFCRKRNIIKDENTFV